MLEGDYKKIIGFVWVGVWSTDLEGNTHLVCDGSCFSHEEFQREFQVLLVQSSFDCLSRSPEYIL